MGDRLRDLRRATALHDFTTCYLLYDDGLIDSQGIPKSQHHIQFESYILPYTIYAV